MIRDRGSLDRLDSRWRARRGATGDEGIAMLLAIMAMLILSSLSILALGAIVVQAKPTQFQRKNVQTINAAEAGLDAGLSAIRNVISYTDSGKTYADRTQLPCWNGYTGQVGDPNGGTLTYSVTIKYFKSDPTDQTAAWRTANAMTCTTGIGTPTTPTHAVISADGIGAALPKQAANVGNRSLQSVYKLQSTNPNLPGGLIKDSSGLCYSGVTSVGGAVTMQTCLPGADSQMWAYTSNYQIVLTSTRASDGTGGLCLSAVIGSLTQVNATMQTCDPSALDNTQKWGVSNSDPVQFFGHLKDVYTSSWCLGVATPGAVNGVLKATSATCTGVYPAAEVGAGAAGTLLDDPALLSTKPFQWVNYQEFGRCLDITAWVVTTPSQILYPCKQDPMATTVIAATPGWNEVFVWDAASKHFAAYKGASSTPYVSTNPAYCMHSPNTNGGYVLFGTLCSAITSSTDAAFTWTVNRKTGDAKVDYTIVDSYGRCLAAGPKNASNASAYSSVVTATCDGSGGQKWNAPPNTGASLVGDIAEVPNH